jgi:hypothetical protein
MSEKIFQCFGPFSFVGSTNESLFINQIGLKKGVYIWAVPFGGKYLVYYVGQTRVSFASRFLQHIQSYLDGFYRVYDPEKFAKADKVLIWGGMWKRDRKDPKFMVEFLQRNLELTPIILKFIEQFQIFLVPIDGDDDRLRERVESAISSTLFQQQGVAGSFQDRDIRYRPRRPTEQPFKVRISFPEGILGLGEELII